MSVQQELRQILGTYGVKAVYATLHTLMREDYNALCEILAVNTNAVVAAPTPSTPVAPQKKPVVKAQVKQNPDPAEADTISSLVQKTSKGPIQILKMDSPQPQPPAPQPPAPQPQPPQPPQPQPQPAKPTFSTLKEARLWQKEQEGIRRAHLEAQGIDPKSLLTEANLKQWMEVEKKPFSLIAREHVGLPEAEVSQVAKQFGIKSVILRGRPKGT